MRISDFALLTPRIDAATMTPVSVEMRAAVPSYSSERSAKARRRAFTFTATASTSMPSRIASVRLTHAAYATSPRRGAPQSRWRCKCLASSSIDQARFKSRSRVSGEAHLRHHPEYGSAICAPSLHGADATSSCRRESKITPDYVIKCVPPLDLSLSICRRQASTEPRISPLRSHPATTRLRRLVSFRSTVPRSSSAARATRLKKRQPDDLSLHSHPSLDPVSSASSKPPLRTVPSRAGDMHEHHNIVRDLS